MQKQNDLLVEVEKFSKTILPWSLELNTKSIPFTFKTQTKKKKKKKKTMTIQIPVKSYSDEPSAMHACIKSFQSFSPLIKRQIITFLQNRIHVLEAWKYYQTQQQQDTKKEEELFLLIDTDLSHNTTYFFQTQMILNKKWKETLDVMNMEKPYLVSCCHKIKRLKQLWDLIQKEAVNISMKKFIIRSHFFNGECPIDETPQAKTSSCEIFTFFNLNSCYQRFFSCEYCHNPKTVSNKYCSRCQLISYCSIEHQNLDWKNHQQICRSSSCDNPILRKLFRQLLTHLFTPAILHVSHTQKEGIDILSGRAEFMYLDGDTHLQRMEDLARIYREMDLILKK